MAAIERERVSVYVTPAAAKGLRRLATDMGFIITSGRGAGRGSLSRFMEAIAEGRVRVTQQQVPGRELDAATLRSLFASGDATPVAFVSEDQLANLLSRHDLVLVTSSENVKGQP